MMRRSKQTNSIIHTDDQNFPQGKKTQLWLKGTKAMMSQKVQGKNQQNTKLKKKIKKSI